MVMMMKTQSATVVSVADVPTQDFPWGAIKWLCSRELDPEAEQTLGLVFINPGMRNPPHSHPNCEELLYVMAGQCEHGAGEEQHHLEAGMLIRIPAGVTHSAYNSGWEPVKMLVSYSAPDREMVLAT